MIGTHGNAIKVVVYVLCIWEVTLHVPQQFRRESGDHWPFISKLEGQTSSQMYLFFVLRAREQCSCHSFG